MKTAMQELIDLMELHHKRGWSYMTFDFFFNELKEHNLLEKEKEQIKNAYIIGFSDCHSSSAKDQDLYFNIMYNGKDL